MDASWLLWLLAAAVLVSMVLLAVVCLHCRSKGPLASIRQASEDYMPSTEFRVIHPSLPTDDLNHSTNWLSPPADPGTQRRHRSVTPTETESNPSYENPAVGADSDADDPPYVTVLPDGGASPASRSRASTPSSDVLHDYENVPEKKEDREYLNVDPLHFQISTPEVSEQSDSDSDDEGNYVNVQQEGTRTD